MGALFVESTEETVKRCVQEVLVRDVLEKKFGPAPVV